LKKLKSFAYHKQIENLVIEVTNTKGSAILGAAALCTQNNNSFITYIMKIKTLLLLALLVAFNISAATQKPTTY